ncbi:hypothetical protein CP966_27920 [Streptomyces galilaeus]|nr:hypothetical protein CP966_27920 [Streptomyces galilaeus]
MLPDSGSRICIRSVSGRAEISRAYASVMAPSRAYASVMAPRARSLPSVPSVARSKARRVSAVRHTGGIRCSTGLA